MTEHEINQLIYIKQDIQHLLNKLERCKRTAINLDLLATYEDCVTHVGNAVGACSTLLEKHL